MVIARILRSLYAPPAACTGICREVSDEVETLGHALAFERLSAARDAPERKTRPGRGRGDGDGG